MRCWIAVILTRLPLQALQPRWSEPLPLAIVDGAHVIALSRIAAEQGVRIGMRSTSVHSIAPQVVLQARDPLREQQSFDAAFGDAVAVARNDGRTTMPPAPSVPYPS